MGWIRKNKAVPNIRYSPYSTECPYPSDLAINLHTNSIFKPEYQNESTRKVLPAQRFRQRVLLDKVADICIILQFPPVSRQKKNSGPQTGHRIGKKITSRTGKAKQGDYSLALFEVEA